MADPNKPQNPTNPPTPPPAPASKPEAPIVKPSTKDTIDDLQEIKKQQGDYRDMIKESIARLKQLDKSYDSIEGKLEGLLEDSINVKDIEKILIEAKEKQFIASKKLLESEQKLTIEGKKRVEDYFKSASELVTIEADQLENKKNLSKLALDIVELEKTIGDEGKSRVDNYIKSLSELDTLTQQRIQSEAELKSIQNEIFSLESSLGETSKKRLDDYMKSLSQVTELQQQQIQRKKELGDIDSSMSKLQVQLSEEETAKAEEYLASGEKINNLLNQQDSILAELAKSNQELAVDGDLSKSTKIEAYLFSLKAIQDLEEQISQQKREGNQFALENSEWMLDWYKNVMGYQEEQLAKEGEDLVMKVKKKAESELIAKQIESALEKEMELNNAQKASLTDKQKNYAILKEEKTSAEEKLKLSNKEIESAQEKNSLFKSLLSTDENRLASLKEQQDLSNTNLSSLDESILSNKEALEILKLLLSGKESELITNKMLAEAAKNIFVEKEKELANAIELHETRKDALSTEEAAHVANVEGNKLAEESVELANKRLAEEKRVKDITGITGHLFEILANKIGVGDSVMGAMVKKARQLREEQEKTGKKGFFVEAGNKFKTLGAGIKQVGSNIKGMMSDPIALAGVAAGAFKLAETGLSAIGGAAKKAGNFIAGLSEHSSDVVRNLTSGVSGLVSKIPLVGGLFAGLIDGAAAVLDLLLGVDNHAQKVGRSLGKSEVETRKMKENFANFSASTGDIFVTTDKLLDTYQELAHATGLNNEISQDRLATDIKLKQFLDYDLQTRQKLLEVSQIQGKNQEDVVKKVMAQTVALRRVTGIQFNNKQIMKELTGLGGALGLQFAKYPDKLAKSLVMTKAMGMDLKKLDSIADQFLDFESSISAEFEAQLLTGKEINLQKARELMLNNDLAGAAAEIATQVGSAEEFLNMNRIQQEAIAKAMGMGRDEMADMLLEQEKLARAQKEFGKDSVKNTADLKEKVRQLIAAGDEQKALNILGSEEALQNEKRANTQERLMGFFDKIKSALVDIIQKYGIMEKVSEWVKYLTEPKNIQGIIGTIKNAVADFTEFMSDLIAGAMEFIGDLPGTDEAKWDQRAEAVREKMGGVSDKIRGMGESTEVQKQLKKEGTQRRKEEKIQELQSEAEGPAWWEYGIAGGLALTAGLTGGLATPLAIGYTAHLVNKMQNADEAEEKLKTQGIPVKDFVLKSLPEDTVVAAGGTNLGRTDEMVGLLMDQRGLLQRMVDSKLSPKTENIESQIESPKTSVNINLTKVEELLTSQNTLLQNLYNKNTEVSTSNTKVNVDLSNVEKIMSDQVSTLKVILGKNIEIPTPNIEVPTSNMEIPTPNVEINTNVSKVEELINAQNTLLQKIAINTENNQFKELEVSKEPTKVSNIESKQINYETTTINNQMLKKEVGVPNLETVLSTIKNQQSTENKKPEVKITQDIKWDPINGPYIMSQIDTGGGDVSKYLNPGSGRV